MADFIEIETHGQTGLLRLNRPEKLNAWHKPMRDEIMAALNAFDADASIRAIIMTGAGERAFCAGQDLAEAPHSQQDFTNEYSIGGRGCAAAEGVKAWPWRWREEPQSSRSRSPRTLR